MKEEASKSQIQYIWINNKTGDVGIPKDYFETICQTAKNNPDKDVVIVYDDKNGGGDFVEKLNQAKLGNIKAYPASSVVSNLNDEIGFLAECIKEQSKSFKDLGEKAKFLHSMYEKEEKPAIKKNHLQILLFLLNDLLDIPTVYLDCGVNANRIDLQKYCGKEYQDKNLIRKNADGKMISTKVLIVKPGKGECGNLLISYIINEKNGLKGQSFREKDGKFYDELYAAMIEIFFHPTELNVGNNFIHSHSWRSETSEGIRLNHKDDEIASDTRKIKTKEELQEVYKNSNLSNDDKLLKKIAKQKPVLIDDYTMINNGKATNEESKNAYFLSSISGKLSEGKIQLN